MRVSGWGVVATGVLTAVWVTIFAVGRHMWEGRQARLDTERAQRQRPGTEIAPVPPPTATPLLGSDGRDADGYPTRYVDRAALRSLLWHKRYTDLTRYFEEFQAAFEADARKEYWPSDAAANTATAAGTRTRRCRRRGALRSSSTKWARIQQASSGAK